jgi:uncharacterized DUF497 family protein
VEFEFDPEKDATNRAKHRLSLPLGAVVLENCIGEVIDDRRDYTMREDTYRPISVRKASRQEQRLWLR